MARGKAVKVEPVVVKDDIPIQPIPVEPKSSNTVVVCMAQGKSSFWHPDQNKWIPDDIGGVELEMDGWLRSQIKAGFVKVIV